MKPTEYLTAIKDATSAAELKELRDLTEGDTNLGGPACQLVRDAITKRLPAILHRDRRVNAAVAKFRGLLKPLIRNSRTKGGRK